MSQHAPHLPPIEHFDAQRTMQSQQPGQHPPPQQHPPPPYAPMQQQQQHPPPYPPQQYQYQNGALPPGAMPPNGQQNGMHMRFPLPPQPSLGAQQMPGGRHKKEIKRRTKTGCLTCRKRRIKVSGVDSVVGCGLEASSRDLRFVAAARRKRTA